jgi:hypothetical protein
MTQNTLLMDGEVWRLFRLHTIVLIEFIVRGVYYIRCILILMCTWGKLRIAHAHEFVIL